MQSGTGVTSLGMHSPACNMTSNLNFEFYFLLCSRSSIAEWILQTAWKFPTLFDNLRRLKTVMDVLNGCSWLICVDELESHFRLTKQEQNCTAEFLSVSLSHWSTRTVAASCESSPLVFVLGHHYCTFFSVCTVCHINPVQVLLVVAVIVTTISNKSVFSSQ